MYLFFSADFFITPCGRTQGSFCLLLSLKSREIGGRELAIAFLFLFFSLKNLVVDENQSFQSQLKRTTDTRPSLQKEAVMSRRAWMLLEAFDVSLGGTAKARSWIQGPRLWC
jgi:hypothetical protein